MKVTEFTIKRSEWLRGEGTLESALLRTSDNKMCCLGFFCIAAGLKPENIACQMTPSTLVRTYPQLQSAVSQLVDVNGDIPKQVEDLMTINDYVLRHDSFSALNTPRDEIEREQLITSLFAEMYVKVNFID